MWALPRYSANCHIGSTDHYGNACVMGSLKLMWLLCEHRSRELRNMLCEMVSVTRSAVPRNFFDIASIAEATALVS